MSTVSKEDNMVLSSEVSSSNPDEPELELGLGLSLGRPGASAVMSKPPGSCCKGMILTAQDFPSAVSKASSSSSSSSSSPIKPNNASCGTKRSADSFSPPRSGVSKYMSSQVVGWPPIRTYRMNSLVNLTKSPTSEDCNSTFENSKNLVLDKIEVSKNRNNNDSKAKGLHKNVLFVKVNMDGMPIGRKVDLNAHASYETLALALDGMFCRPCAIVNARSSHIEEQGGMREPTGSLRLLDEASEYVLTYEDKDKDWMLVGDVPWEMFISSVKRLRIMRTSEANGLASGFQERNKREKTKFIWT